MATVHGRKTKVLVNERDLSSFFRGADSAATVEANEDTTFGVDDKTYVTGLGDGTFSLEGVFKDDPADADAELEAALGSDTGVLLTVSPSGLAVGERVRMAETVETSYEVTSPVADVVSVTAEFQADGGIDAGVSLHDATEETTSANGTSVDNSTATANGGVGHLHVTAASGTTPTLDVKIQDSVDNSIFADLITFTQATVATSERQNVAGTVDQFVRAVWTVGGTTPAFTFSVAFARR